jgi:hypothetical protein
LADATGNAVNNHFFVRQVWRDYADSLAINDTFKIENVPLIAQWID